VSARVFAAAAAVHAVVACVHVAAIVQPSHAGDSIARHAAFVAVNAIVAAGFVRRPRGFAWLFGALTLQQLASHGAAAMRVWRSEGHADVASVAVVVWMPCALAMLVRDRMQVGR
jgi:hypothetical protein